jgi:response regulator RpfG family c-di-GMP phosphodiesterase
MLAKKIAIVDDESELAETMNEFLNSNGFEAVFFTNPNKLLEFMKSEELAMIFSDMKMPEKTGIDLFQSICSLNLPRRPRFVLMSGHIDNSEYKGIYDLGVDEIVSKPFDLNDITTVANLFLENGITEASADTSFYSISIMDFINSSNNSFDVFLKIDSKFICVAQKGQPLTRVRIEQLHKKGLESIYLRQEDFLKYSDFQLRLTEPASMTKLDVIKRKKLISHFIDIVAQSSLIAENKSPTIEKAMSNLEGLTFAFSMNSNIYDCLEKMKKSGNLSAERSTLQAVLASAVANSWGWTNSKIQAKIIMSALFCDIGLRELPHLQTKRRFDFELKDIQDYESHTERSAKILQAIPGIPPEIVTVARQHHESDNGNGFPFRLKKDQLHPISRIVHVVSDFLDLALADLDHLDVKKNLDLLVDQRIIYAEQVIKGLYLVLGKEVHPKLSSLLMPDKTMIIT